MNFKISSSDKAQVQAPVVAVVGGNTSIMKPKPGGNGNGKRKAGTGRKIENPSSLFLWWEQKAQAMMWVEMIALTLWTFACAYLVITLGFYQDHKSEEFVVEMFGYHNLGNNEGMRENICSLVGVVASFDNFFTMILFYLLSNGVYERNWRKVTYWIIGKLALFTMVLGFTAGMLNASKPLEPEPMHGCTVPYAVLLGFILTMISYRGLSTYIMYIYVTLARDEKAEMNDLTLTGTNPMDPIVMITRHVTI